MQNSASVRIASIDVLRAITMFGMIFVNDLWSLKNIPSWLEHVGATEDGMGLADIVFPGFLFIVGMSIPFAVRNRQQRGDSTSQLLFHILTRAAGLLLMGVFLVNGENINEAATGMRRIAWNVICWLAFFLLWNQYPKTLSATVKRGLQVIALGVLVFMAVVYRGGTAEHPANFSTWWWGILGLIGWAYLVASAYFVAVNGKLVPVAIGALLSLLLCAAHHLHLLPEVQFLNTLFSPIAFGAMTAFTLGGAWASSVFWNLHSAGKARPALFIQFFSAAVILLVLGFVTRPIWGISKIQATPSWVLICSAIALLVFLPIYWLVDLQQKKKLFALIAPAGTDTLLCYAMPYFAYALMVVTGFALPDALSTGIVGLLKSILFSLIMIQLAGWLSKKGLKLKL